MHQAKAAIGTVEERPKALLGTALTPERPGLSADIWGRDVEFLSTDGARDGAVRQLAIVLDYIGQRAAPPAAHLLDDTYNGVFNDAELSLGAQLRAVKSAAANARVRPSIRRAVDEVVDGLTGI